VDSERAVERLEELPQRESKRFADGGKGRYGDPGFTSLQSSKKAGIEAHLKRQPLLRKSAAIGAKLAHSRPHGPL
jgi:hypothetical protein